MKVIRVGRSCLLAMLALGGVAATGASAAPYEVHALPEIGRCLKVPAGQGIYKGGLCIARETAGMGKWEWTPVSGSEKQTFTGAGGETNLATVGHSTVKCTHANFSGEWEGPKTAAVTVEFQGCENPPGTQCTGVAEPTNKGVIKTSSLEAELGFLKNQVKEGKLIVSVGLDLKPKPPLTDLAFYECGNVTETARVEGSVIGQITPFDKMSTVQKLVYKLNSKGQQLFQHFEGGPQDTLTTTFQTGLGTTSAPTTLKVLNEAGHNANALEIKAKEV